MAKTVGGVWNTLLQLWAIFWNLVIIMVISLGLYWGGKWAFSSPKHSYQVETASSDPPLVSSAPATADAADQPDGLHCELVGGAQLVTMKAESMVFAINGTARARAAENGWLDGKSFFEPPRLHQLLEQGVALCGTGRVEGATAAMPTVEEKVAGRAVPPDSPLTVEALIKAANDGDMALVKRWVDAGKSANVHDTEGSTAVDAAAASGHCGILDVLLKHGGVADPKNVRVGFTPLAHAAWGGHSECVALLLKNKVRVDVRMGKGDSTPLILAAYQGDAEVVRLLVDAGASLTITNNDGDTPYRAARHFNNLAAAAYIESRGGR